MTSLRVLLLMQPASGRRPENTRYPVVCHSSQNWLCRKHADIPVSFGFHTGADPVTASTSSCYLGQGRFPVVHKGIDGYPGVSFQESAFTDLVRRLAPLPELRFCCNKFQGHQPLPNQCKEELEKAPGYSSPVMRRVDGCAQIGY